MKDFLAFLKNSQNALKSWPLNFKNIHFTLGNESCDLDSTIAALILSYFHSKQNIEQLVVPILNVSRENFLLRTENCFVLRQAQVPIDTLQFRNEIQFEEIFPENIVTVSLVDHHILSKNDEILAPFVTEIFDHRPINSSYKWDSNKVQIRIEQVGSCCTLIADEILKASWPAFTKPLAYLLYQTIVYDTIALKPENHKATVLDISVATKLENMFGFTENRQVLFDKLWQAHNDVSHLTARQLLDKDMKKVEGVYIPGLPMLVEEYLILDDSMAAIEEFAEEYQVTYLLLVGLNASKGNVKRDLAIYSKTPEDGRFLLKAMESNMEYDFMFEERKTKFGDKIHLRHIHNTKISRKQLVPIVNDAWRTFNCKK